MNDTRLWHVKSDVEDALTGVRKIMEDPGSTPEESTLEQRLLKLLREAHALTIELMKGMDVCLTYSAVGSCCYRVAGHEGGHRSEWGHTWTDAEDLATGAYIAASMDGRRD